MKTIILLFLATISYSQTAAIHFYGSSEQTLGSEVLFLLRNTESCYLGGGFSGALVQKKVMSNGLTEFDKKQAILDTFNEEWCSIYATGSLGFIQALMVKFKAGLGVYNHKIDFVTNNGYEYTKIDRVNYQPMVGISGMYTITKDIGMEIGFDTFNKGTIGFTILF